MEYVVLDARCQTGRHGILERKVSVGIALVGGSPQLTVRTGQQGIDGTLSDRLFLGCGQRGARRAEGQLSIR